MMLPDYIYRPQVEQINEWIDKEKILILKGARQVGKTTILNQLCSKLEKSGKACIYLLADHLDNQNIFKSPQHLIQYLKLKYSLGEKFLYIFIDEFQVIPNSGLFLKNIFDEYKHQLQLIVSGSSSLEITQNIEFLTGREISFSIPRISFKNYFLFKENIKPSFLEFETLEDLKQFYEIYQPSLERYFFEYLSFGAYPEVLTFLKEKEKQTVISSIAKTYIEKDIAYFYSIRNLNAFNQMLKLLADGIGMQLNRNELANTLQIDHASVSQYLDILEGTYICKRLKPYYKNIRSEVSKMPKIYFLDLGLRNYLLNHFSNIESSIGVGNLVENFVYNEISHQVSVDELRYYRTISGSEIDFVIENTPDNLTLIEVKYRPNVKNIKAFNNFKKKYPETKVKQIVLTKNQFEVSPEQLLLPVVLTPFWDFKRS